MCPPKWLWYLNPFYWLWVLTVLVRVAYWLFRSKYTPCDCGYICDWVYPYGFVPEAECPVHDK